jgi:hypothetical protein
LSLARIASMPGSVRISRGFTETGDGDGAPGLQEAAAAPLPPPQPVSTRARSAATSSAGAAPVNAIARVHQMGLAAFIAPAYTPGNAGSAQRRTAIEHAEPSAR